MNLKIRFVSKKNGFDLAQPPASDFIESGKGGFAAFSTLVYQNGH